MASHLPTASLAYRYVPFVNRMAATSGSDSSNLLVVWRPNLPEGWYYLGQAASGSWGSVPRSIIIKDLEPDVLREVAGWEKVWDSRGSNVTEDFALWRGIPPSNDYVVVGGIFTRHPGLAPPNHDETRGIMAVRRTALVQFPGNSVDMLLVPVWLGTGFNASRMGSVWRIINTEGVNRGWVVPNTMIPAVDDRDWRPPANDSAFMLPASALDMGDL